jgi:hypothetical protein
MPLTREERKLLHQKSKEPTFGSGKPDSSQGLEGDLSYRKISGSGTVQYIKQSHEWIPMSSSGTMPPLRIGSGGGGTSSGASGGISSHTLLDDLDVDTHLQYLLIDGTRAMTGNTSFGVDGTGVDVTFHSATSGDKMLWDASEEQLVITGTNGQTSLNVADGNVTIADGLTVGADLTVTGGDIIIGAVATSGTITVVDSAVSTAGNLLSIGGSDVTAGGGGTANVQGGAVIIKAGTSTGTAASGSILFQTAPAGGVSGTSASNASLATVLTIAGDASSTFTGALIGTTIDASTDFTIDGLVITADTITNDAALTVDAAGDIILDANSGVTKYYLAGDTNDYASLTVAANGVTTLATFDDGGTVGHLTLDADGDIILDAAGKDISLTDGSGTAEFIFNLEAAPELDVDGAFTIDGSSSITIDAVGTVILIPLLRVGPPVAFTSVTGMAHGDEQTTYDSFGIRWKTLTGGDYNGQHIAGGEADYTNNYAMIGTSFLSTQYANHATDFVLTGG